MKKLQMLLMLITLSISVSAKEYHVSKTGNDENIGSLESPLLTIQKAANLAQAGDIITVHEGVYRERITPPRGGESDTNRIIYRAAEGEKVEIKGSEIINSWVNFSGKVWKATIPNSFFGEYNPFKDKIHGDWFYDLGRIHHTGDVYLNEVSLWESATLEGVLNPKKTEIKIGGPPPPTFWFCESDNENTYIYANFRNADPNKELVEINVRKSCFYPEKTGINFLTIRGFILRHAATQWAPPTAEQIGLVGTNWSKGWIIENNTISDSRCSGITLGKHGDEFDNTSEDSAEGYVETIKRATASGWNKENIGSHIIRNNTIYNCEQTGICGSMGGVFSTIENNNIHHIWRKRQFTGAEMGGIKIHGAIDMLIKNNKLTYCDRGVWLDWMAQGTRVTCNFFFANSSEDIFVEVNHGPFLIDNNILFSETSLRDWSEGGAYIHNLFAGNIQLQPQNRLTPFQQPHSTEVAGLIQTRCGDNRFFNNIFLNGQQGKGKTINGLQVYNNVELPVFVDGNVYLNGVSPFPNEENNLELETQTSVEVNKEIQVLLIDLNLHQSIKKIKTQVINSKLLGKAIVSNQGYEDKNGSSICIETDYFGNKRKKKNPTPGPFENPEEGKLEILMR